MILIKNAQVFAPKALGKKDVLLAYDKILEIADCIEPWRDDLTVIDTAGKMLVPGFIDQHVHIVGGGGEGGFETRDAGIPAFQGRYLRRDDARRSARHRRLHQEP